MAEMIVGGQIVCIGMLAVLIVYLFSCRDRELSVLLCSAVLLLASIVLSFANLIYNSNRTDTLHLVTGGAAALTALASAFAMVVFLSLWQPGRRDDKRPAAGLGVLIPVCLAGLGWFLLRQMALFPIAETFSLLIIVIFYQLVAEADLKKRTEEVENQQAMVFQWQMRPHFLFNTMNTIQELCDTDPTLARAGIENLAGYLRKNLDAMTSNQLIPFQRELAHIEQYVMLEKMNPANQFEVVYDLQIINFMLPALSVQPLVENAIRYGVRALGGDGMVFVTTERHGESIRIIVEDNGPGFSTGTTKQQREHASQGLQNVRKRLEAQCGGSLHIRRERNKTRLIVLLPKIWGQTVDTKVVLLSKKE